MNKNVDFGFYRFKWVDTIVADSSHSPMMWVWRGCDEGEKLCDAGVMWVWSYVTMTTWIATKLFIFLPFYSARVRFDSHIWLSLSHSHYRSLSLPFSLSHFLTHSLTFYLFLPLILSPRSFSPTTSLFPLFTSSHFTSPLRPLSFYHSPLPQFPLSLTLPCISSLIPSSLKSSRYLHTSLSRSSLTHFFRQEPLSTISFVSSRVRSTGVVLNSQFHLPTKHFVAQLHYLFFRLLP